MTNTDKEYGKIERKPRVQFSRKVGHLWQVFYGLPGNGRYGYGVTRKQATAKAKADSISQSEGV